MEPRLRRLLLTVWVLGAIAGGIATIILGSELLTFVGVLLIIAGLMSSMLMMDEFFDAAAIDPDSAE